ncbi:uncharacterized protein ColSpa_01889 [Colletotrichum spaethianum]|uniref:Uncharacterized protein n=1 Tax=Colletotrichum spaethianum TaxID=700344 RepID=A0AA37NZ17_9PEZI|nr:uncharacterized protein ColSpa_01889 [Colletotrichum spaethianum]GKT41708.1 hypothetical protein ColSpa_01889 [Colletotrichum spaethianum]
MDSENRPREQSHLMTTLDSENTEPAKTQGVREPSVREKTYSQDTAYEAVLDRSDGRDGGAAYEFRRANKEPFVILADVFAVICPVAFLAFAFLVLKLDGQDIDGAPARQYRNAITILATLFPIIFAAIVGRLMSQVARWKLEKGATMGVLEQLMGSRTVGGTLLVHFQLRALNLLALFLVLIWIFSPLGGQSVLRMLETRSRTVTQPADVVYFDTNAQSQFASWSDASPTSSAYNNNRMSIVNAMYNALILSPDAVKSAAMDVWGNVKVPALSSYGDFSNSDWQSIPMNDTEREFSSLVGVPVTNIAEGNTTFSLESSYIHLECENISVSSFSYSPGSGTSFAKEVLFNETSLCMSSRCNSVANGTWQGWNLKLNGTNIVSNDSNNQDRGAGWNLALDNFVDELWNDYDWYTQRGLNVEDSNRPDVFEGEKGVVANPTTLLFQAKEQTSSRAPPDYITSRCGVTQKYVESRVHCSRDSPTARQNCSVIAQRPSQRPHADENISQLSFVQVFRYVSRKLPQATNHFDSSYTSDISLNFLENPSSATMTAATAPPELASIPPRDFGYRLAQLVNSYVFLSQAFSNAPSGSVDVKASFEPNVTVAVDVATPVEVFHVSSVWMALYILSCVVLLLGGTMSAVVTQFVHGPEILGYASTVVRDSKFMDISPAAGRMDGIDLTRMLKDRRVRFGYTRLSVEDTQLVGVGSQEEVNRIKQKH